MPGAGRLGGRGVSVASPTVAARVATHPLIVPFRIAAVLAAQLFDLATFTIMVGRHGIGTELNPLVAHGFDGFGMPMVVVMKVALVVQLASTIVVLDRGGRRRHPIPGLAATIAVAAVVGRAHRRDLQHPRHLIADPAAERSAEAGQDAVGTIRWIAVALLGKRVDGPSGSVACLEDTAVTRTLAAMLALPLAVALVAGCASASAPGGSAEPVATASAATPRTAVQSAEPSASAAAESAGTGDTTVRPGEAWIVSQRRVDLDGSDELGTYLVRPDGTGDHQLVPELDGSQIHATWSPDGEGIAFIQENPEGTKELWVVGADGTDARQVAPCEYPCNNMIGPEWSPGDPGAIYVGRDEGPSKFMLSRVDLDTGKVTDVIVREDGATAESWRLSRDAKTALVIRDILTDAKRAAIFVVDLATGEEQQLTEYAYDLDRPDWMPDGRIIFNTPGLGTYNENDAGPANLWVMDADGGNLEQLTHYAEQNSGATQPHVLADGSGIVFTKVLDGTLRRPMAIVDMDGGNERYLTPTQAGARTSTSVPCHDERGQGRSVSQSSPREAGPTGVVHAAERPGRLEPGGDGLGQRDVERRSVGADPRGRAGARGVLDRVDVEAAHHVADPRGRAPCT